MNYLTPFVKLPVIVGVFFVGLACAGNVGKQQPQSENDPQQTEIVAEVNGRIITAQAFAKRAAQHFSMIEKMIYRSKHFELEEMINEILIQQEAKSRGISKEELIAEVTDVDRISVSDVEVAEFYSADPERFPEGLEAAMEKIQRLVREEKANDKLQEFALALRNRASVTVYLSPPSGNSITEPQPVTHTDAVAEVNGTIITDKALEERVQGHLADLEPVIYEIKKTALERLINEMLIEEEAKRRGVSIEELFELVTHASTLPVSDEEVERFYNRMSRSRAQEDERALKEKIREKLRRRQALPKWQEFIEGLESRAAIKIYLKPPPVAGAMQQEQNEPKARGS